MSRSGDFISMAKKSLFGRADDIKEIMAIEKFFPPANYEDPESVKNHFYIKTSYRDHLYQVYMKNEPFRIAINSFLKKGILVTDRIMAVMRDAIKQKEAMTFEVNGFTGSGKSAFIRNHIIPVYGLLVKRNYTVHCDISNMEDNYKVVLNKDFKDEPFHVYVTYSNSETNEIISEKFKTNDIIFQDEMPQQHGKGSSVSVDNLENILRVAARKKGINIIFISPEFIEMKNVDYYLTILAINKIRRITVAMISTKSNEHIGCGIFRINIDPGLDEYYERVSAKRKTEIQEAAGYSNVKLTPEKKEKLVSDLMNKVLAQSKLEAVSKIQKSYIKSIAVTTDLAKEIFMEEIISAVFAKAKNLVIRKDEVKVVDNQTPKPSVTDMAFAVDADDEDLLNEGDAMVEEGKFVIDIKQILEQGVKKYQENTNQGISPEHAEVFLESTNPDNRVEDIALKHKCVASNITIIKRRVGEWIAKIAGRRYEEYIEDYYKNKPEVDKVIRKTAAGNPDLVVWYKNGNIDVFSLKCYSVDPRTRTSTSIPKAKIETEIIESKRLKKQFPEKEIKCILVFYNALTQKTQNILVDYERPLETYLISTN
jgi:hypothetical protein